MLAATDLFLASTERARVGLLLEGVPEAKVEVCAPGIDVERFAAVAGTVAPPAEHVIISPGRLVWEKGHHDALRALALLHRGIVKPPDGTTVAPRLRIVGAGPEEARLRAAAQELGVAAAVDFGSVPYPEMPAAFAAASCLLLGSQSSATGAPHPFGMARALAAGPLSRPPGTRVEYPTALLRRYSTAAAAARLAAAYDRVLGA